MKFNPITKTLFTDDGKFIKKIGCPYRIAWQNLISTEFKEVKTCDLCDKTIHDTAYLSDEIALNLAREDSGTCFKVDINQHNLSEITSYDN